MKEKSKLIILSVYIFIACIIIATGIKMQIDRKISNETTVESTTVETTTEVTTKIPTTVSTTSKPTTTTPATTRVITTKTPTTTKTTTITKAETTKSNQTGLVSLGTYKLTAYCSCYRCCGKSDGITASGTKATEGRTIAVDTRVIPFGTKVIINGRTYVAEDRGGAIKGNRIDIFFNSHQAALNFGVRYAEVFKAS